MKWNAKYPRVLVQIVMQRWKPKLFPLVGPHCQPPPPLKHLFKYFTSRFYVAKLRRNSGPAVQQPRVHPDSKHAKCLLCKLLRLLCLLLLDHLMTDSNKTVSETVIWGDVRYRTAITVQLNIPVWGEKTMAAAAAVAVHVPSLALCSTSFVRRRWLITAGMIGNWPLENNLLRGLPPGHTPLPQPPSSTLPPPLTIICLICASLKTRRLILMNRCLITL